MQDVANTTVVIAANEQRIADADAMTRAEVSLKDAESEYRIEIGQRKGINAANVKDDSAKWYDDQIRKHSEELQNDAQRRGFNRLAMARRSTFMDFAGRHQSQELTNAWTESKNANIQASINAITASGGDEAIIRQERGRIESNLVEISQRNGLTSTPEKNGTADMMRGKVLTGMHAQVLQQLVESDPRRAQSYLDKYKSEIDGDKRAELEKFVRKGTIEADGRDMSLASIAAGYNGGLALLKKEEDAAKLLPSSGDREAKLDVIEKARQFHNREFAQREQQLNYNQRKASEQAYSLLRQGKDVPIGVRNAMDPHAAMTLEKQMAGSSFATDWKTYNDLRKMSMNSPAKFAEEDLSKHFDKLAPRERESLLDLQQTAAKNANKELKEVATLDQQIATAHNMLKFKASDHEKKGMFDVAARASVQEEEKALGRKLNYDERQKVLDRLMVSGEVLSGAWYKNDPNVSYYEVYGKDGADRFAPTGKDDFYKFHTPAARSALLKKGVTNPSEDQIRAVIDNATKVKK